MGLRALVIGGTSGIGYGMACRLAAEASSTSVIISGRTKPTTMPHSNMEFRPLDASSMRQIKQYTDTFKSTAEPKLDFLVMTQGIMTTAGRTETPEGIDRKMALHYYGKQLLIRELLPVLQNDAKVVIVLDGKTGDPSKLDWEDLDLKNHYSLATAANHCIVMNDIMVQYHAAQQKLQGTERRLFVHAYPGGVETGLFRELPWYLQPLMKLAFKIVAVSPDVCAERLLSGVARCAASGESEGRFWSNIDNRGHLIGNKKIFSEEQRAKVAIHTWNLVDEAIGKNP
ncbi:hypothetical protein RBB50_007301 [Rhinocladiella similis]